MEPKALKENNNTPATSLFSPTKEFLNLSSSPSTIPPQTPETKTTTTINIGFNPGPQSASSSSSSSFQTPSYINHPNKLIQQTCPPKPRHDPQPDYFLPLGNHHNENHHHHHHHQQQQKRPLFPITGQIEDQPDEKLRLRLLAARRKTLMWAPKIGSPLGR